MKTATHRLRAADLLLAGLLAAFTGCTSMPVRQATSETSYAPTFSTPATRDFEPPKPLRLVDPSYPFDLKRAGITGRVDLSCLVDELGRVQDARVENATHSSFSQPALEALQQWTFRPAIRNGQAIAMRVTVPMSFLLND